MNHPRRREVERFIHIDSRDFSDLKQSSYNICFGSLPTNNIVPTGSAYIPVQDYNNVVKLELKVFISDKPDNEDYVLFKIKNIEGKVDTTTDIVDACTVCYFDQSTTTTTTTTVADEDPESTTVTEIITNSNSKKPIYFGGTEFEFNPPISKLSKLEIDVITSDGNFCEISKTKTQSFLLKITYIEGHLY